MSDLTKEDFIRSGDSTAESSRNAALVPMLVLAIITVLCLAPFASKPFHIDDPLFVWVARHIQTHPLDPFGFTVNWYGWQQGVYQVTCNPPLSCYLLCLAARIVGWRETALHCVYLIPAIAAVLGTYRLAEQLRANPFVAALAMLFTPAFMVSGASLMCDTTALAFVVWAAAFWIRGVNRSRRGSLAMSSLLLSCAMLTKFNTFLVVPVLAVYAIVQRNKTRTWVGYLAAPTLVLATYVAWLQGTYGAGGLFQALQLPLSAGLLVGGTLVGLSFTGGCVGSAIFLLPLLYRVRSITPVLAASVVCVVAAWRLGWIPGMPTEGGVGQRLLLVSEMSLMVAAGIGLFAVVVGDFRQHRDAGSTMLALWFACTVGFVFYVTWSASGRYLLALVPAAAIMMARRLDRRADPAPASKWRTGVALALAALLSLAVCWADFSLAQTSRAAARVLSQQKTRQGSTLWFEGHWGFQYYMEASGAQAADMQYPSVSPGDLIVVPRNSTNVVLPSARLAAPLRVVKVGPARSMAVHDSRVGAGFYGSAFGPIPFFIGHVPPELYYVFTALNARQ